MPHMENTMKPATAILENIRQNSERNKDEIFTRLFRYMLRPELYYLAYKNLYANQGAATRGINTDTADGFSEAKVERIIKALSDGSYIPSPVRRTYIPKRNGRLRPLGIPTFTDKLVQEVLRMILEAVYEPVFLPTSHGFRPGRSCHTALGDIRHGFNGIKWFIEGDIKGFFDNIDHQVLPVLIGKKIKDARLIQLVQKMLKAGYVEDWKYQDTISGTPQGGIISPLLANIYLHELDKFVQQLQEEFDRARQQELTPEYIAMQNKLACNKRRLSKANNRKAVEQLLQEKRMLRAQMLRLPAKSQTDKRLKYVRYADDFIIGIKGSKEECEKIKQKIKEFLAMELKLELSEEKTLITHSANYARFLGYDICVRRNNQIKRDSRGFSKRTLSNIVELCVPLRDKIERYLFDNDIVEQVNGELRSKKRNGLIRFTDLEILTIYNAELRGICNYYCMASNFNALHYFAYLMEYSCLKTLAGKHKSKISKIKRKYRDGQGNWNIPYETRKGVKRMSFAKYQESKKMKAAQDKLPNAAVKAMHSVNSFDSRLKAHTCELCGKTDSRLYEVHHVKRLKDLNGKSIWERAMIARKRKTIVLCCECHHAIHDGKF